MNTKKMTQEQFDNYMTLNLIPEIQDEFSQEPIIILIGEGKFKFAIECKKCHDLILLNDEYDIPKELVKLTSNSGLFSYLEALTGLYVYDFDEIIECECFTSEENEDEEDDEVEYEDYEDDDLLKEDAYDDYDEY